MNNENITTGGLLANKVAIITGAGRGIGAAAARLFVREEAVVMLASRTEAELKEVVEEIRAAGGTAEYVVTDLADPVSINRAVETTVQRYGRLDIAFNNAGLNSRPANGGHDREDFDLISSVNFKGVWMAMTAEVRAIRATARSGAIVNNSSVGSFRGAPGRGAYGAAKRAVNSLTETAAVEYGPEGIRVNAVAPVTTMTAMMQKWASREPNIVEQLNAQTPLRRAARPEEIAEAAAWLLSDRASYVAGCILPVDGGMGA